MKHQDKVYFVRALYDKPGSGGQEMRICWISCGSFSFPGPHIETLDMQLRACLHGGEVTHLSGVKNNPRLHAILQPRQFQDALCQDY